jgi:hypothetical protein
MSPQQDHQQRINRLKAELFDIGLDYNTHYKLVQEGTQWTLDILRPVTTEQYQRAAILLARTMNQ